MEAVRQIHPEGDPWGMYLAKSRRSRQLTSLVKIWGRGYTFTVCIDLYNTQRFIANKNLWRTKKTDSNFY